MGKNKARDFVVGHRKDGAITIICNGQGDYFNDVPCTKYFREARRCHVDGALTRIFSHNIENLSRGKSILDLRKYGVSWSIQDPKRSTRCESVSREAWPRQKRFTT